MNMEEQNQQQPTPQPDKKSIEFNYRLFVIGKWMLFIGILSFFVLMERSNYAFVISSILIVVSWIIIIPSAIVYKRKSKQKIGFWNWLFIFSPIIIVSIFIYLFFCCLEIM